MSSAANTNVIDIPPLEEIIDLNRYPIHDLEDAKTKQILQESRERLDYDGCALIKDFLLPESLDRMRGEAERLSPQTFWSESSHTPYFTKDDPSLAEGHPKRFFQKRSSGYINSDILEATSDLRAIYESPVVTRFIGACLNIWPLYTWADPLGCNPYSIMNEDSYFPWHFDGNEFTVSLLVQDAEKGGVFEYAADIRNPDNENFEAVSGVLNGNHEGVNQLELQPGDLQIFKGRFSMHRVTHVEGKQRRIIALPTYVTDTYSINRPERSKHLYGRAMPIHYEREKHRVDGLTG